MNAEERELVKYCVAQERHQDQNLHLHAFIELDEVLDVRYAQFFDIHDGIELHHGNYQAARSCKKVVKYCTKKDDFISNFDTELFVQSSAKRAALMKRLLDGTKLVDLVKENPELLYGYKRLKADVQQFMNDKQVQVMRDVKCTWIWGPTRLGKSWDAIRRLGGDL